MARSAAYRWQNERKRSLLAKEKRRPRPKKGITNKQAKYLKALQRELGEPYSGNGLTRGEASRAIAAAKRRLKDASPAEARPTPTTAEGGATRK